MLAQAAAVEGPRTALEIYEELRTAVLDEAGARSGRRPSHYSIPSAMPGRHG